MGLKGDLSELAVVWRSSPWRVKLFLAISGFLATSSIASLAEAVAKWKGFLLTGIAFHRQYVSEPVATALRDWLSLPLTRDRVDWIILYGLIMAATLRGIAFELHNSRSRSRRILSAILLAFVVTTACIAVFRVVRAPPVGRADLSPLVAAYVFLFFWCSIPPREAWSLLVQVHLAVPPLLICLLAAINTGLK